MMPTYAFMKFARCKECVENIEVSSYGIPLQSILMKSPLILEHLSVTTVEKPQESSHFGIFIGSWYWGYSILPKLKMDCRNKGFFFFSVLVSYIDLVLQKLRHSEIKIQNLYLSLSSNK